MEKKFKKNGVYVFKIKDSSDIDDFYFDKEYEYDVYYFKTKKLYDENHDSISQDAMKEYFVESVKGLLPRNVINSVFTDECNLIIEEDNLMENKPVKMEKNKFYCVVLDIEHIDALIFDGFKYKQKVYEFKTKEEQKRFIDSGKCAGKLVEDQSRVLHVVDEENVTYLASCGNNIKVLEKDYILAQALFNTYRDNSVTKVIFYPSLDTYVFNCHEDYIVEAINILSEFSFKERTTDEFFKEVEDTFAIENGKKLKYKYIGKSIEASPEDLYITLDESIYMVSTFPKFDIIWTEEEMGEITNLLYYKKLFDALQSDSPDDIKFVTEFLIKNKILNEQGQLLEPYKNMVYVDGSTKKSKGTFKTKK